MIKKETIQHCDHISNSYNQLSNLMNYLLQDMNKKSIKIYYFQYWEYLFNQIKKEYSLIRVHVIQLLNSEMDNIDCNKMEFIFNTLEDLYEQLATVFLEKKLIIQERTTYFDQSKPELSLYTQWLIKRRLFNQFGLQAIKIKIDKQ